MQYAMLIYETPENFESRKKRDNDAYIGAWRAYQTALVAAGVHAGGERVAQCVDPQGAAFALHGK